MVHCTAARHAHARPQMVMSLASATHVSSHPTAGLLQQSGSTPQTHVAQVLSSQPRSECATQQLLPLLLVAVGVGGTVGVSVGVLTAVAGVKPPVVILPSKK